MEDYSEYVHPGSGDYTGRWFVALIENGRYFAPVRKRLRRHFSGGVVDGPASYVPELGYSYARRSDAVRRARELYDL